MSERDARDYSVGLLSELQAEAINRDTYPSLERATESKAHARRRDRPRPSA